MTLEIDPLDLDGYKLWPDGSISVEPKNLTKMLMRAPKLAELGKIFVTEITPEIVEYNQIVDTPITIKKDLSCTFPPEWSLPEKYKYFDLDAYLFKLVDRIKKDHLYDRRIERLSYEIYLFQTLGLNEVLRTLIYIIEEFERQNVVWGVGRGSSCSSYLLYLIGLHEVDAVKYGIDVTDFIREK